ncbi:MAG: hypothetical protein AB7D46_00900 [Flavobacteriaceae bacterium]
MGTGKRLRVESTGFPGTNKTWRFIQESWREPLEALAKLMGSGALIISGCEIDEGVASPGYISYDGVIYYFEGGEVPITQAVVINTVVEDVEYDVDIDEDGQRDSLPGYETKTIKFGTSASIGNLDGFKRLKTILELSEFELPNGVVIDPTYIKFTQELLNKLNGIEAQAKKNVQTDWNVSNSNSDAFLKNKPSGLIKMVQTFLWIPPDIPTEGYYGNFTFSSPEPNLGYEVFVTIESTPGATQSDIFANTNLQWSVYDRATSGFKIFIREFGAAAQNNIRLRINVIRAL